MGSEFGKQKIENFVLGGIGTHQPKENLMSFSYT
jgi:hypothetical protein